MLVTVLIYWISGMMYTYRTKFHFCVVNILLFYILHKVNSQLQVIFCMNILKLFWENKPLTCRFKLLICADFFLMQKFSWAAASKPVSINRPHHYNYSALFVYHIYSVVDPGGDPRMPWNPPFSLYSYMWLKVRVLCAKGIEYEYHYRYVFGKANYLLEFSCIKFWRG